MSVITWWMVHPVVGGRGWGFLYCMSVVRCWVVHPVVGGRRWGLGGPFNV